jgi:superfamily I DNA and/or RNA helicase/ssDNA-binding Zn-finger/Zn-ribbon topoisomerase 1
MNNENNSPIQEMLLAIEANIAFLQKEGNAQLIVRNGKFVNDIGESFIYEFVLDFFQDIEADAEVEIRTRDKSAVGKVIAVDDKKIQVSLDKNLGTSIPEARLVISNYYLLKLLHEKLKAVESGEIEFTDLSEKLFGLQTSKTELDDSYQIPYSLVVGIPNKYQEEAIRLSLGSEVSFIWGPPGTGKTQTIARIIEGFISKNLSVLLLSHTNKATDGALYDAVELLKNTEDYEEGRFIRVGKDISVEAKIKNDFPLVIQENILQEKSAPIRNELTSLGAEKSGIEGSLKQDEVLLGKFFRYESISGEIDSINREIIQRKKNMELSIANLDALAFSLGEIESKIIKHQNEGFLGRLFLGSLENILKQKTSILTEIAKENNTLESSKGVVDIANVKLSQFLTQEQALKEDLKNEKLTDIKNRYENSKNKYKNIEKQISLVSKQLEELSINLIKEAKLIATTLTKSYSDKVVLNREYDCVIVDEASMAPLPALWCASGLAKQKVVIVGDFYQLPPVVKHRVLREKKSTEEVEREESLVKNWLSRDIFEVVGIPSAIDRGEELAWLRQLRRQYRMHPDIADIINRLIYSKGDNKYTLESDESTIEKGKEKLNKKPLEGLHIGIYDTGAVGSIAGKTDSGSYYNFYHAFLVVELAKQAIDSGYKTIGIITPFRPQANLIQKMLVDRGMDELVIADTVHRFQGGQKQVVIFDVTTPNPTKLTDDNEPGGDDEKIFNVAFSRSQEKCIIVADVEKVLKKHSDTSLFREFIDYCAEKDIPTISAEDVVNKYYLTEESEKWLEKVYSIDKLAEDAYNSKLFDEADFYPSLMRDLLIAEKEVIIDSPFIGFERMRFMMPMFQLLREKNIKVFVLTRKPSEHNDSMKQEAEKATLELESIGVVVLLFKGFIHRKIAVIDRRIVWEGSLNILSQRDSKESMRRFDGKETAEQVMSFLKLDKNIGKIGENNITHCEYCNKPGSWYWTDKGMYGVWTFCLNGMHKKGALLKTEVEIKRKKKELTVLRKSTKKKASDRTPICQVHDTLMIKRKSRFGEFWGCPNYPRCRNVEKMKS